MPFLPSAQYAAMEKALNVERLLLQIETLGGNPELELLNAMESSRGYPDRIIEGQLAAAVRELALNNRRLSTTPPDDETRVEG
jgi:hypothetical protein